MKVVLEGVCLKENLPDTSDVFFLGHKTVICLSLIVTNGVYRIQANGGKRARVYLRLHLYECCCKAHYFLIAVPICISVIEIFFQKFAPWVASGPFFKLKKTLATDELLINTTNTYITCLFFSGIRII